MKRILSWLLNRTVLELLGLAIAAALIWYVGDSIAFGTVQPWRPLEPSAVRLTLIGLIFATWLGLRLWRLWRSHKANAALLSQLAKDDRPAGVAERAQGAEEVAELRKRFESALATLKKSGSASGQSGLFAKLSRQYVYQMPWYLFIGAPGSGKTTALVNSGLEFPLADKFGKASIRGVGGTRNCDWWFTNEAVLIDTAGRYTTQESNLQLDKTEWEGFLALLRKYRPRAPINGVILAISVSDLLGSGQEEREQHAAAIRRRLTELQDQLEVRVPVYAVVTKVDLLAGFNEYFGRLTQEERAQIWGLTFPANEEGEPTKDLAATFQAEYRLLERRIEDALPDLLQSEPDVQRRALVYAFTQQFAGLRDVLGQFLATLFSESKFAQPPIVRGVYFTSGTQEGTPFDRVLGSIQRRFGVQARVQAVASAQGTGKSYFLRDLLQKLVFAEAHLVGRNPARERRRRVQRLAGIAACVVVLIGAAIIWTISFSLNRAYLTEVAPKVDQLKAEVQAAPNAPGDYVGLLPILNHARDLAASERFSVEDPPLSYRWGLYQGSGVQAKADPVYEKLLADLLLPRVALRLAQLLKDTPPDDLEIQYGRLKAYLMLHEPVHYDPKFLMDAVSRDWQSTAGQNLPREAGEQLTGHLRRLLDGGQVRKTTEEKDNALVARVRQQLGRYTPEKRLYGKLKGELVAKGLADFTLLSVVGADANSVFARASPGKLLDEGVSGVYTRAGYEALQQRLNDRRLGVLVENWVLGGSERSASAAMDDIANNRLATEIRKLYLAEYQKTWDVFLADVRLIPQQDLDRLVNFVGYLAAPDSPLFRFTEAVAKETKLSDVGQRTAGLAEQITDATKEKLGATVQRLSGGTSLQLRESGADSTRAGQIERQYVDIPFERWQRLAAPSAAGSGEGLRSLLSLLQSTLQSVQIARRSSAPMPPDTNFTRIRGDAQRLPPPLREMVEGLASSTSSQAADTVRRSVGAQLGAGVADSCRNAIKGRYPFDRNGRDVLLDDFVQIFRAGGSLDEHFQKNLASQVDQSKKPWAFRNPVDNSSIGGASMLLPFQNAAAIREAFFRGPGGALQFQASIRVLDMDPSIKELTLDVGGQSMKYVRNEPGRSKNFVWPPPGGSVQVRLQPDGGAQLSFDGPWALHHLFDKAAITQGGGPEQFTAALIVGGRPITLDVIAGSVRNPFRLRELETFTCPGPQ